MVVCVERLLPVSTSVTVRQATLDEDVNKVRIVLPRSAITDSFSDFAQSFDWWVAVAQWLASWFANQEVMGSTLGSRASGYSCGLAEYVHVPSEA